MRIVNTVIECNAEELRCSNTLTDSFANMLRMCFGFPAASCQNSQEEPDEESENG